MILEINSARKKRRTIIIKGVSQDLNISEISAQLGTSRGIVKGDIKFMRRYGDVGFQQAEKVQAQVREKKVFLLSKEKKHFKQNERFQGMTGISLREKSFRNMIDFNKHELLEILKSEDQHLAIMKLSKSIKKTLKKNGIITIKWQDNEITQRAQEYLTTKNTALEI